MRKAVRLASKTQGIAESSVGPMFDRIAPTYDLLNHLLSFGQDCVWRSRVVGQVRGGPRLKIIDLATGTGDLLIALLRGRAEIVEAVGLDISENMLAVCREKLNRHKFGRSVQIVLADASATPFPDRSFEVVTMAFGIRNTADTPATLGEIHRILKPGGEALILEFSLPRSRVIRWCYLQYLRVIVPFIGRLVSGDTHAYRYLDRSIEDYHQPDRFSSFMRQAGFHDVSVIPLTFGVASIYRGGKGLPSG